MKTKKYIGSTFDSFLDEEGIKEEVELRAMKKMLAERISELMDLIEINRTALAIRMETSRTLVNRLLDPNDTGVTLETLGKASRALHVPLAVLLSSDQHGRRRRARGGHGAN